MIARLPALARRALGGVVAAALSALTACTSVSQLDPATEGRDVPRMVIAPPAPDADRLMACFGKRLGRYVDMPPGAPPPVIVEVEHFVNRNPGALQRIEVPTDATTMLESLLANTGKHVAFRDGSRKGRDVVCRRDEGMPSTVVVKGDIQIVEASLKATTKTTDVSLFVSEGDAAGRRASQANLAAITLEMTATNPAGLGEFGLSAPVRIVFERSATAEKSFAASFSTVALGVSDQTRTVFGYVHALRLGAALQLVTVMSRATKVGAGDCLRALSIDAVDIVPLQKAIRDFRAVAANDPLAAAFWLNKLRALHGKIPKQPFGDVPSVDTSDEAVAMDDKNDEARTLLAAGILDDLPLAPREKEFALLWSRLPDVPSETFVAGARWIDEVESSLARQARGARPSPPPRPRSHQQRLPAQSNARPAGTGASTASTTR